MIKTEDKAVERELEIMHNEWAERRAERDLQAAIRLENLATWTMFHIASDSDGLNNGWILSDGKWIRKFPITEGVKIMESIYYGYDAWKTASPYDEREQREADILEQNLAHCPFCLRKPFFEDDAHTPDVFVTCACGASMRGRDYQSVASSWDTRPQLPIERNVVRSGPREFWTGA